MGRWRCMLCGYVYDPKIGDIDGGVGVGVEFEVLPEDWVCPICGALKEDFEKVE